MLPAGWREDLRSRTMPFFFFGFHSPRTGACDICLREVERVGPFLGGSGELAQYQCRRRLTKDGIDIIV